MLSFSVGPLHKVGHLLRNMVVKFKIAHKSIAVHVTSFQSIEYRKAHGAMTINAFERRTS